MHRSSRAPVLSATRSLDSCWITGVPPSRSCSLAAKSKPCKDAGSARSRRLRARLRTPQGAALQRARECEMGGGPPSLPGGLHDFHEAPVLGLRDRSRLDDADDVSDVGGVLLVVRVELHAASNDLLVARMRLDRVDLHHDGLVHCARDDHASALLSTTALGLKLRQPRDRLALGRSLAPWLRTLPPLRARYVLALLLLFRDSSGRGLLYRCLFGSSSFGGRFLGSRLRLSGRLLWGRCLGNGLGRSFFGDGLARWLRLSGRSFLGSRRLGGSLVGDGFLGRRLCDRLRRDLLDGGLGRLFLDDGRILGLLLRGRLLRGGLLLRCGLGLLLDVLLRRRLALRLFLGH